MPGPTGAIVNQREVWLDAKNEPVPPGTSGATRHMLYFHDNGEIWASDWKPAQEWWQQGPLAPGQSSQQGQWSEPYYYSSEKKPSATAQWSVRQGADGRTYRVNELTGEAIPIEGLPTAQAKQPSETAQWSIRQGDNGQLYRVNELTGEAIPIQGMGPDAETSALRKRLLAAQATAAERGPLGRQLTPAELELQQLHVQKAQRELANPMLLAQQQIDEVITNLADQYAQGKITLQERNRMMDLAKQGLMAQMQGTTPAAKAGLAGNVLGNESQLGGSLANSLLGNITGMAGKIMAGPAPLPQIDPFALAKYGQSQLGAGPEITGLARSLLTGFMQ